MTLLLIPLGSALPALQDFLDRETKASGSLTAEKRDELDALVLRFATTAQALLKYTKALNSPRSMN